MASTFCRSGGICGCVARGSRRFCGFARRSCARRLSTSTRNGFIRTDPPILTPAACEGTSTLFPVDYFGDPAYLTQSGQLYVESTALALGKVYSFGPTFRAEKSKTRRHLTEFWMVEPEVAYMDLDGLMELAENFISHIVQSVLKNRAPELQVIGRDAAKLETMNAPFPRLRYDEAVEMLNQAHKDGQLEAPFEYGNDFGSPDETWLSSQYDRPVMVHRYPANVKAFYMEPDPKDPRYALCVDVLAPEGYGEIIGGSQRVSSYELLSSRIDEHKLPREAFEWYLDLRRYGSVPHSGFGMGIERVVCVGVRAGPRARDDSVSANAEPDVSVGQFVVHSS